MNNNSCNQQKTEKLIRQYTIYQIQNLFKIVIYANNLLKENNFLLFELDKQGKKNTDKYQKRVKFKLKLTKIVKKAGEEILYILKYPERIKIREVPIGGILNQRTMILKSNRDKEYKLRNLRKLFYDVKEKFTINHHNVPDEYSTKYLDHTIHVHKEMVKKLVHLKEKLSGKKEFLEDELPEEVRDDNRSFLEKLLNCPTFPKEESIIDQSINEKKINQQNERKKLNNQEKKLQESEKSTLHKIEKILSNLS